jgi:hypothetical protein
MLLLLPFFGAKLTPALLWAPALLAALVLLTTGLGAVLACANLFYRDVKYITQVLLTFGIFFTPVLFDLAAFGPRASRLLMFNPLSPLFEGLSLAVMRGHNLLTPLAATTAKGVTFAAWQPWYLLYSLAWTAALVVGGVHLFRRTQDLFASSREGRAMSAPARPAHPAHPAPAAPARARPAPRRPAPAPPGPGAPGPRRRWWSPASPSSSTAASGTTACATSSRPWSGGSAAAGAPQRPLPGPRRPSGRCGT